MLEGITTAICRPPRAQYSVSDLGPPRVRYRGVEYKRKDFNIKNNRGMTIKGSMWELINPRHGDPESCILYLHPNSGSRVDVVKTRIMSVAATAKCTVCGFDFTGCGSSDGDNVTLGVREKEDICAVMSYLLLRGCKKFVLWGRSMGAASAAMFFGAYKEIIDGGIVALVLDSPFTSMHGLAVEYTSSTKIPVPNLLLSPALHVLRQNIMGKHDFDILHISPIAAASRITVPTVVLSGSEDKIVPPALSESIYSALNGPKLRIFFQGGHNTHRPSVVFDAIRVVLTGALRGLRAEEYLHLSAEVISNHTIGQTIPYSNVKNASGVTLVSTKEKNTKKMQMSKVDDGEIGKSEAKLIALKQEQVMSSALQSKAVGSLTDSDITMAISERKKSVTGNSDVNNDSEQPEISDKTSKNIEEKVNTMTESPGTSSLKEKNTTSAKMKKDKGKEAYVSVQLDVDKRTVRNGDIPTRSSWSESIGSFFWGRPEDEAQRYPSGSLGNITRLLSHDICPPDDLAWEELLISHAISLAFNDVTDQIISIVAGLEDTRLEYEDTHPDMNEKDIALMMSMVVANVTAEMGIVSAQGIETTSWGKLCMLSFSELQETYRSVNEDAQISYSESGERKIKNVESTKSKDKPTN